MMNSLAKIYGLALRGKDFLYEAGFADVIDLPVPVLSVGNLSVGGTGKTPVTDFLLRECERRGIKPAVVSRNYKAKSHGIHRVNPGRHDGASYYGDEPFWLARRHHFPVYVGPMKAWTAVQAVKENKVDLVIVDDGFQHRGLHRDFDCVLLDATASEASENLLPAGRLREDFSALKRAELVIITKANWASSERVQKLKMKIPAGIETVEMNFRLLWPETMEKPSAVLAFCGIARPETFRQALQNLQLEVKEFVAFADHHAYSATDVAELLKTAERLSCDKILTTEKDFVKIAALTAHRERFVPVGMTAEFLTEPRTLNAFFDKLSGL
jgi:tetraacyldisaccharide 4'-kinase